MASDYGNINEIAQESIELANKEVNQTIASEMTPSVIEVKKAAADLVLYTEILIQNARTNEKLLAELNKKNDPNYVITFGKKLVQTKENYIELMRRVLTFQNIVNNYLGQTIQMTYVYISKEGQVELYKVENDVEHLTIDRASKSHGGAISGRYKYSKKALSEMQRMTNENYDQSSLDSTFSEVYQRYKISKAKMKMGGAAYILWKENGWDGAWISGQGPLGESYLNFFLNEYLFSGMVESDVRDFMLNSKYGAVNADNASGFLQGDVTKNNIEYGVKMAGASAFSYMEVIEYAKAIQDVADIEEFLRGLKQDLAEKASSNLVKPLEKQIEGSIENLIKPMEEHIAKLG